MNLEMNGSLGIESQTKFYVLSTVFRNIYQFFPFLLL
jgi:hypothetical protein